MREALAENVRRAEERVTAACQRAGRPRSSVTLMAVTKTVGVEVAALLPELGIADLGENRPQELWRKAEAIRSVRWHFIGHLQRNKVERTLPLCHRVHSADSLRLLEALDAYGCDAYLEFNCSGEASKGGFAPTDAEALVEPLSRLHRVRLVGLMTMAAPEDPEACRPAFRELRRLRDLLRTHLGPKHPMDGLSMGMSNDFEVAIEEGATIVRLGSLLFEGLP